MQLIIKSERILLVCVFFVFLKNTKGSQKKRLQRGKKARNKMAIVTQRSRLLIYKKNTHNSMQENMYSTDIVLYTNNTYCFIKNKRCKHDVHNSKENKNYRK